MKGKILAVLIGLMFGLILWGLGFITALMIYK